MVIRFSSQQKQQERKDQQEAVQPKKNRNKNGTITGRASSRSFRFSSRRTPCALIAILIIVMSLFFKDISLLEFPTSIPSSTKTTSLRKEKERQKSGPEYCLRERGMNGRWVQDWDYANRSYYPNMGSYSDWHIADQQFIATPSQPFRLATSYKWIDDSSDDCPIHEVNLVEFCNACYELGINQILIMGDSLSIQFTQSLHSLLGFPPEGRRATGFNARLQPWTMTCPANAHHHNNFNIIFQLMRYSPLSDWKNLAKEGHNQNGNARAFVEASQNKTVVIANLGVWMETTDEYKEGFMSFLEWINSFDIIGDVKNKIIPFWRPTIPGHFDCLPQVSNEEEKQQDLTDMSQRNDLIKLYNWSIPVNQHPYQNHSEYKQINDAIVQSHQANGEDTYRWPLIEKWNEWSYQQLYHNPNTTANITNNSTTISYTNNTKNMKIHWLNIFPSAILRRDGHIGFTDCLHYYLPGPTDWWAHFFHSTLVDLAAISATTSAASTKPR